MHRTEVSVHMNYIKRIILLEENNPSVFASGIKSEARARYLISRFVCEPEVDSQV